MQIEHWNVCNQIAGLVSQYRGKTSCASNQDCFAAWKEWNWLYDVCFDFRYSILSFYSTCMFFISSTEWKISFRKSAWQPLVTYCAVSLHAVEPALPVILCSCHSADRQLELFTDAGRRWAVLSWFPSEATGSLLKELWCSLCGCLCRTVGREQAQ